MLTLTLTGGLGVELELVFLGGIFTGVLAFDDATTGVVALGGATTGVLTFDEETTGVLILDVVLTGVLTLDVVFTGVLAFDGTGVGVDLFLLFDETEEEEDIKNPPPNEDPFGFWFQIDYHPHLEVQQFSS